MVCGKRINLSCIVHYGKIVTSVMQQGDKGLIAVDGDAAHRYTLRQPHIAGGQANVQRRRHNSGILAQDLIEISDLIEHDSAAMCLTNQTVILP